MVPVERVTVRQIVATACVALLLSGCSADNYARESFGTVKPVKYVDADTRQGFFVFDKPSESRMKMMLDGATTGSMLLAGRNAVPPMPIYEAAGMRYLAQFGRHCTVTRSFEIVMSEVELQYVCS